MKVRIETDEWYPVHSLSDDSYGDEVDVPLGTLRKWRRIEREFRQMQDEMDDALTAKGKATPA